MTLIFDILESYHMLKAREVQHHYQGASLTNTIAWHQSLTRNRYLKKQNRAHELALLETIQAAASWPIDRVHEIHPEVPNQCPLCQQEIDNWHSCWTCPALLQIEEEDITYSSYLIEKKTTDLTKQWAASTRITMAKRATHKCPNYTRSRT